MAPSVNEQYIVDEKGNTTAIILPIKEYKKMLSVLEEVENHTETKILSQSAEFKKLVKRGLEDIRAGRTKSWKEVWRNEDLPLGGLFQRRKSRNHQEGD